MGGSATRAKARKRRLPKVYVQGDDGAAMTAIGDPWASGNPRDAAAEMERTYNMAVGHLSIYGQRISDACDSFKNFTETKIENMDTDDVNKNMLEFFFKKSLDVLEELVPGLEGLTAVGKVVQKTLKDAVRSTLESPLKHLGGDMDEKKLKRLMRDLTESGKALKDRWTTSHPGGQAGTHKNSVLGELAQIVSRLQSNLKAGAQINVRSHLDQVTFLETFYDSTADEKAALLEYFYAIPKPVTSKYAGYRLYKELVHRFAPIYGWATADSQAKAMHNSGHPSYVEVNAAWFRDDGFKYWYRFHS